jgi:hypothetical protein
MICKSVLNISAGITVSAMTNARMFNLAGNITATGTPVITLYAPLTTATAILGTLPSAITVVECYTTANPPTSLPSLTVDGTITVGAVGSSSSNISIVGGNLMVGATMAPNSDRCVSVFGGLGVGTPNPTDRGYVNVYDNICIGPTMRYAQYSLNSLIVAVSNELRLGTQSISQWADVANYLPSSHTITHRTNIIDYTPQTIGCFCSTTNELADVYDSGYIPTLNRPCDAICKVRPATELTAKVIGIIADDHTIISHGDCLVVVKQGPTYEVGDILTVDSSGLCRKADEQDKLFMLMNRVPMPKITIVFPPPCEFVACFIG